MTTGNPYRRRVVFGSNLIIAPLLLLFWQRKIDLPQKHCTVPSSWSVVFWNQPSRNHNNRGRYISIWVREVQINSVKITQVADWVIETLKIGKLNKIQRLHKSNFEDAFPKQGRKHALTKYDKPGVAPSRVNKTSIRLHNWDALTNSWLLDSTVNWDSHQTTT